MLKGRNSEFQGEILHFQYERFNFKLRPPNFVFLISMFEFKSRNFKIKPESSLLKTTF